MAAGKTIGILGGMGPEATADLFHRLIRATPANCDQEHLHILVDNDPSVPDRTASILAGEVEPVIEKLIAMAQRLEAAGADLLIMPCNTAHSFLNRVRAQVSIPFIDMVEATVGAIRAEHAEVRTIGLLATSGTLRTRLYHRCCARHQLAVVEPVQEQQDLVMQAIHSVKSRGPNEEATAILAKQAADLIELGAGVVVAGCTEIPLALRPEQVTVPLVNPTEQLARAAVRAAMDVGPS